MGSFIVSFGPLRGVFEQRGRVTDGAGHLDRAQRYTPRIDVAPDVYFTILPSGRRLASYGNFIWDVYLVGCFGLSGSVVGRGVDQRPHRMGSRLSKT